MNCGVNFIVGQLVLFFNEKQMRVFVCLFLVKNKAKGSHGGASSQRDIPVQSPIVGLSGPEARRIDDPGHPGDVAGAVSSGLCCFLMPVSFLVASVA